MLRVLRVASDCASGLRTLDVEQVWYVHESMTHGPPKKSVLHNVMTMFSEFVTFHTSRTYFLSRNRNSGHVIHRGVHPLMDQLYLDPSGSAKLPNF